MSKSNEPKPAIEVKGITKTFKIPLDKGKSVKSKILGRAGKGYREFTPLNDISFTVYEGDFFGIVGRNGSGKSTLLKTIAGIYEPTAGRVKVNGTLVPFIELGVGFNPNLTGRENVYLNAALLGFSRSEIDDMYDDIVDFAELHDFMDERLQNYSSGMQVRLAFSIAIRAKGDILLLDEVLAVGDTAFQQKCYDYFEQLKRDRKTVILVTHSMVNVERFCNRGLMLHNGEVKAIGSSTEIADEYRSVFARPETATKGDIGVDDRQGAGFSVLRTDILQGDKVVSSVKHGEPFDINLAVEAQSDYVDINAALQIRNKQDILLFTGSTKGYIDPKMKISKGEKVDIKFSIEGNYFTDGDYVVSLTIWASDKMGDTPTSKYKNTHVATLVIDGVEKFKNSLYHPPYSVELVK